MILWSIFYVEKFVFSYFLVENYSQNTCTGTPHILDASCEKGKESILPLNKPKLTAKVIISDARSCIVVV